MLNQKKILTFLLALLTVSSAFYSCSEEEIVADTGNASDTADTAAEETEPILPDMTFDGAEIMFLTEESPHHEWYTSREIYVAELNGELLNDAVFERNLIIEDQLEIKIAQTNLQNASDVASKSLIAGDDEYDVVMPYMNKAIPVAQQGLLMDLNTVPYLHLEREWWDQRANADLILNGKQFFSTGDISILDNECTMVMFFNKDMITDFSLASPYDYVQEGTWTIDVLSGMITDITADADGDTVMTTNDRWGLSVANLAPLSFYFGSGERLAKYDADGTLNLAVGTNRAADVMDKVTDLCYGNEVISYHTTGAVDYDTVSPIFNAGRLMFVTHALVDISGYREAEFEFGILPYPKYDETQDSYHCLISTGLVASTSVPYNCTQLDAVGVTLEALAYYSKDTLTVAYYDTALKSRYVRDEESGDMLDIIFANRVYDLGYIFNWGGIGNMITDMYKAKNDALASTYASIETKTTSEMQETIDAFAEIK